MVATRRMFSRGPGVAPRLRPRSMTERLFLHGIHAIPVPPAAIERNSSGVLFCRWDCPCPDIEALWTSITPREVVLSTKISHCHIGRTNYLKEKMSNRAFKRRMVRDGLLEVSRFLRGEVAVSVAYKNGEHYSSGWCKLAQLSSARSRLEKLFGPGLVQRAWNWSGEIGA